MLISGFEIPNLEKVLIFIGLHMTLLLKLWGELLVTGPDKNTPTKVGPGVGDIFSGLMMSFGIISVLRMAEKTSKGQFMICLCMTRF